MKIIIDKFEQLAEQNDFKDGNALFRYFGGGSKAYKKVKANCRVSYDIVKEMYNKFGVGAVLDTIDMEGETLNGFKSKYVEVGNYLF